MVTLIKKMQKQLYPHALLDQQIGSKRLIFLCENAIKLEQVLNNLPSCIYPVFFTFALFIGQLTLKQLSRLIFFYFVFNATLAAQSTVFILKAESSIAVDGNITHAEWDRFEPITDFTQNFPFDTGKAQIKTCLLYTSKSLHFSYLH